MSKSPTGKPSKPMTVKDAARFYRAEAKRGDGSVPKGSAAARVMGAAMRNELAGATKIGKSKS